MKYLITLVFILSGFILKAQNTVAPSESVALEDANTVHINVDKRIAEVVNKPVKKQISGKIRGYRVQIFSGVDRNKANQAKIEFMKANPGIRSYLEYYTPQFRVKVGDFRTKKEANQLFRKLSATFHACMIVPDVINFTPPRKPKETTSSNETTTND